MVNPVDDYSHLVALKHVKEAVLYPFLNSIWATTLKEVICFVIIIPNL